MNLFNSILFKTDDLKVFDVLSYWRFDLFCFELLFGVLSISLIVWRLLLAMLDAVANCWLIFSIKFILLELPNITFTFMLIVIMRSEIIHTYFWNENSLKFHFSRKALSIINFWNCYRNFTCVKLLLLRGIDFQEIRVLYLLVCLFFSLLRFFVSVFALFCWSVCKNRVRIN